MLVIGERIDWALRVVAVDFWFPSKGRAIEEVVVRGDCWGAVDDVQS